MRRIKDQEWLLDHWEYEIIKTIPDAERVIWSDQEAYHEFPLHRWVYDKLGIAKAFSGLKTWDLRTATPSHFPVIVRPRVNLLGMGHKTFIASDCHDMRRIRDCFAQEIAMGDHCSSDFIVVNGKVVDSFTFSATKDEQGSFTLFSSTRQHSTIARKFVDTIGLGSGVVNVETIGFCIIEAHLRPSLQFYNIDGGLVKQLPQLVKTGKWEKIPFEKTYSLIMRASEDAMPRCESLPPAPPEIRSVELTWEPGCPLSMSINDENSYRYAIINGTHLPTMEWFAEEVDRSIIFE